MRRLLLIGGGGHCKSVVDSILSANERYEYEKIGIIDQKEKLGRNVAGVEIIGTDEDIVNFYKEGYNDAFITVGSIGDSQRRTDIYERIKEIGFQLPNIIDKNSVIAGGVQMKEGVYVGKGAVINTDTQIDACAIINTGVVIEHECSIGRFSHIAPGATVCGMVRIGDYVHVGANATIIQGIEISDYSVIGAGSSIIRKVERGVTMAGNPGRVIK